MIKTKEQIKMIGLSGKILAMTMKQVRAAIKPGITLKELDGIARKTIDDAGARPAFLNYKPYGAAKAFPASICTSLNEVVVHGIPTHYELKSGDLLSVDFGVNYQGYISDAAFSIGVDKISSQAQCLIDVTKSALLVGIKECKPGKTLGDIGYAINNYVTKNGFKVVKGLTGHGVGLELHEEPSVFNEGQKGAGLVLKEGMVLALEPMVSAGSPHIIQLDDDSYATQDNSLSAHFEHTVAITKEGPKILTK